MNGYSRRKFFEMLDESMAKAMPVSMTSLAVAASGPSMAMAFAQSDTSKVKGHESSGWVVSALRSRQTRKGSARG